MCVCRARAGAQRGWRGKPLLAADAARLAQYSPTFDCYIYRILQKVETKAILCGSGPEKCEEGGKPGPSSSPGTSLSLIMRRVAEIWDVVPKRTASGKMETTLYESKAVVSLFRQIISRAGDKSSLSVVFRDGQQLPPRTQYLRGKISSWAHISVVHDEYRQHSSN